ncbi:MAG: CAP domain-containing protein [Epsilonproteobacteria bacterium]|nr:CAP domain-containing protein [Campylobacterota bacterium]
MRKQFLISLAVASLIAGESFQEGYDYLNSLRQKAGLIPLKVNSLLEKSAQNHAIYVVNNNVVGHYERSGDPYFTGVTPADRAMYVGYPANFVVENISYGNSGIRDSIDGLFSAIYHRLGFLNVEIDEIGVGYAENERFYYKNAYVYNMGNSNLAYLCSDEYPPFEGYGTYATGMCKDPNKKVEYLAYKKALGDVANQNSAVILWPYPDGKDIPPAFYEESPDPLPECSVTGYPISVSFNPYKHPQVPEVLDFYLEKGDGERIDNIKLLDNGNDPNEKLTEFEYVLFPLERLEWGKEYKVHFEYLDEEGEHTLEWKFKTRSLPYDYYIITPQTIQVSLVPAKTYALYFPPKDCNDQLGNVRTSYYSGVTNIDLSYLDHNTLLINVTGRAGEVVNLSFANGRNLALYLSYNDDGAIKNDTEVISSSEMSSSSESFATATLTPSQECERNGGVWLGDEGCYYAQESSSSSGGQTVVSNEIVISSSSQESQVSSSEESLETSTPSLHRVKEVLEKISQKMLEIKGYFAYFGEGDPYDWIYLSSSGNIFAKLDGMDSNSGSFKWVILNSYFPNATYKDGKIVVGIPTNYPTNDPKIDAIIEKLYSKREIPINGYFTYYGDIDNYDPYDWLYVSKSKKLIAKLEGMNPDGTLKWMVLNDYVKDVEVMDDYILIVDYIDPSEGI